MMMNPSSTHIPRTGYELDDRSKEKKSAVKCQTNVPPVFSKEPIKNFKPLLD